MDWLVQIHLRVMIKMQNNIDFKGKQYGLYNGEMNEFEVIDGPFIDSEIYYEFGSARYVKPHWELHTNPDYKESKEMIYTQEMFKNNEIPKVGMMVLSREEELEVVSVYRINTSNAVLTLMNNKTSCVNALYFKTNESINIKPIDQRTDEEKAIDDLIDFFRANVTGRKGDLLLEAIKAGKIHGVTFTESK